MSDKEVRGRIILGSGRSGTTWVQDCLADANDLRPIFEPLHEAESELGRRYAYDMIMPDDECGPLKEYFTALSQGRIHSRWIDYRGRTEHLLPRPAKLLEASGAKAWVWKWRKHLRDRSSLRTAVRRPRALIKCIRANLMAGWLARNLRFKTLLIVRHPCATVESQLRNGSAWDPTPVGDRYRNNTQLHEVTEERYLPLLNRKLTTTQALTLNWVIENQWPVERASDDRYVVSYYEHFLSMPATTWRMVCTALDLGSSPGEALLCKPSQQSFIAAPPEIPSNREARWRRCLTAKLLVEIQGILDAVECGLYDVNNEAPLRKQNLDVYS